MKETKALSETFKLGLHRYNRTYPIETSIDVVHRVIMNFLHSPKVTAKEVKRLPLVIKALSKCPAEGPTVEILEFVQGKITDTVRSMSVHDGINATEPILKYTEAARIMVRAFRDSVSMTWE